MFVRMCQQAARLASVLIALGFSSCGQRSELPEAAGSGQASEEAGPAPADAAVTIPAGKLGPVVFLEPANADGSDWKSESGLLTRELFRQALLLGARQSLGLTTRDGSLRELLPEGLSAEHALHFAGSLNKGQLRLAVSRGQGNRGKVLWSKETTTTVSEPLDLLQFVAHAEELSRTGFLTALQTAGFDGKAIPNRPDVAVPPAADQLLGEMAFPAQFVAVRALHQSLRDQGESPWLLGGLARGYANLGVLTECLWGPSFRVYKARALLYAQRLVHADPQSPWGLWHRAYAGALAGLHQAALNDLAQATRLRDARMQKGVPPKPADQPPQWVSLIEAVCRFDAASLQKSVKHPQHERLAQLLRFRVQESKSAVHLTLQAAQEALRDNPLCFRIYDSLANTGGVSTLHATTLAGMLVFEQSFPQQLKTLSGLPAPVAKTLDQHLPESQVLDSLVAAGKSSQDRSELSWTALGRWAQDTRFLQYCSRLWFMSCQWAVPVDDVLPVAKAAAAGHPYAKFVDSLGLDRQRQRAEIIRLLADFPLADLDYRADPLFQTLYQVVDAARSREITQRVHDNFDDCYEDFAILLNWIHGPKLPWAKTLLRISPYSPAARAILIAEDWEAVRDKAEQWEKESQRPEVLLALGRRYSELKKLDDAERCFQRALALSPEIDTYRLLAGLYKDRGQTEQWLGTLEKVLQEADTGLDHASVRVEIARHFMAQKDFRRAQPYAEAAAESWARWAMQCASECEEGLGNSAQAELWARRISERYAPDATYVWFFWCQRTGKGDLQAAQRFYAEELQRPGAPQSNDYRLGRSVLWALTGEPRKAAEAAEPVVAAGANALFSVFLALFLDEAGERQRRDQALKAVDPKNPYKPLADFFLACLAKGETAAANVAEAEMILKKLPPRERLDSYCLLGRFLELHGQAKAAREYYQRQLAEEPFSTSFTAILSGSRLHREGK